MRRTPHDDLLAQSWSMVLSSDVLVGGVAARFGLQRIHFQFPPKIVHDHRKGSWGKVRVPSSEPPAWLAQSDAREIGLEWMYVVEDQGNAQPDGIQRPSVWTSLIIATQLRALRGYFQMQQFASDGNQLLVFLSGLGLQGGAKPMTARLMDVNIKPSKTLVGPASQMFPLRTDVTVALEIWTAGGTKNLDQAARDKLQAESGLEPVLTTDWY